MLNQRLKETLLDIITKNKFNYIQVIKKNPELVESINNIIEEQKSLKIKIYWILNDLIEPPKCENCKQLLSDKNFKSINEGYSPFCSVKCMRNSDYYQKQYTKTCLQKYKVASSNSSSVVKLHKEESSLKKYGVKNYSQTEEFKEQTKNTWNNKTKEERNLIKNKKEKTSLEHFGVEHPSQSKKVKDKIKQVCLDKYGVENPNQSKEIKEKYRQTCLEKYGVENYSQTEEFNQYHRKRYLYDEIYFDSSWEVEVYKFCKSHNLNFKYHPKKIAYSFNEKTHYYFPDFEINGVLYEIKGDHLIDNNGVLINPYSKDSFTASLNKAKTICMRDNNVIILKQNDLKNLENILC